MFDAKKVKNDVVNWIRDWFENNGKNCNAIVGVSGGKDSSIVAALCVEALGKDRVIGVLMPNGIQPDIDMAKLLVDHLGINYYIINIKEAFDAEVKTIQESLGETFSKQAMTNLPPRIRMATLYAVSQTKNGRVANTCNLSEDWIGYSTKYGDCAGDFSPLNKLTVQEVKAIGKELKLPDILINKIPSDGLQEKTDEDNLGFTYAVLDKYIREGICEDDKTKERIDYLHKINEFKLKLMEGFEYTPQ